MLRSEPYLTVHALIGELIVGWSRVERNLVVKINWLLQATGRKFPYNVPDKFDRKWQLLIKLLNETRTPTSEDTENIRRIRRSTEKLKTLRDHIGHGLVVIQTTPDVSLRITPPFGQGILQAIQKTYTKTLPEMEAAVEELRAVEIKITLLYADVVYPPAQRQADQAARAERRRNRGQT